MTKEVPDFSHLPVTIRRWKLGKRQTIEIHRDFVRFTERGLFARNWEEPLSAFEGVLCRTATEARGGGVEVTIWVPVHLVELVHPDTKKTLRLYKTNEEEGIRKLWEDAAKALDLPALDEIAGGIVVRATEDLDKSLRQLAVEGKVSVDFDADAPPPRGIVLERAEGEFRVILGLQAYSYDLYVLLYVFLFIFFIGGAFLILLALEGVFEGSLGFFVGFVGVSLVTGGGALFWNVIVRRCIVMTSAEIRYFRAGPFGTFGHKAIPLDQLEEISYAGLINYTSTGELVMEWHRTIISIGGLGKEQLRWLEQFILAAIIHPPR